MKRRNAAATALTRNAKQISTSEEKCQENQYYYNKIGNNSATADMKWEISLTVQLYRLTLRVHRLPHWQRLSDVFNFILLFRCVKPKKKKKNFRLVFVSLNCVFNSSPFELKTTPKVKNKSVTVSRVLCATDCRQDKNSI